MAPISALWAPAIRRRHWLSVMAFGTLGACAAGPGAFDFDLRDNLGNAFDTTRAVTARVDDRPSPDDRGVISYPSYQVAVARRGETVQVMAQRLGLNAAQVSEYNGLPLNVALRRGEVVALPNRIAEPSPATGAATTGPIRPAPVAGGTIAQGPVSTTSLDAGPAPTRAPTATASPPQSGAEPIRHKVGKGETAFSIARLYAVPAKALGEWNGLGPDLAVREGQFLLIPVAAPVAAPASARQTAPGAGSVAPVPPSAATPLPDVNETAAPPKETPASPDLVQTRTASSAGSGKFAFPVTGSIIRAYAKGSNEGIDISAAAGSAVKAAEAGTVAAITRDTDQVPIIVLRHADNVLSVYAGVEGVTVANGAQVARGQTIARIRDTASPFLHFEVREGFESVDPVTYLQ